MTATGVDLVAKPLAGRRRPDRDVHPSPRDRNVPMSVSRSFPTGFRRSLG